MRLQNRKLWIDRASALHLLNAYAAAFDTKSARIALRYEHAMRVAALCDEMDVLYGMLFGDMSLSWLCGLLHDIGRFEQLRIWGTLGISCRVAFASGCGVVREAFVLSDSCFVRFGNRYTSKGRETKGFDRDADFDNFL